MPAGSPAKSIRGSVELSAKSAIDGDLVECALENCELLIVEVRNE